MVSFLPISEYKSDYIQFLNNDIIGQSQFSGFRTPFKFISKRSHVEMLFVTDDRVARSGFMLNLTTTNDDGMLDLSAEIIFPVLNKNNCIVRKSHHSKVCIMRKFF